MMSLFILGFSFNIFSASSVMDSSGSGSWNSISWIFSCRKISWWEGVVGSTEYGGDEILYGEIRVSSMSGYENRIFSCIFRPPFLRF